MTMGKKCSLSSNDSFFPPTEPPNLVFSPEEKNDFQNKFRLLFFSPYILTYYILVTFYTSRMIISLLIN